MEEYDLRPVNGQRLKFSGEIIGEAASPRTEVRIYRTDTGYVAEVRVWVWSEDETGREAWETRAYMSRDGDRLARVLFSSRGGMERDDDDLPLLRAALDQAGIEAGRRV